MDSRLAGTASVTPSESSSSSASNAILAVPIELIRIEAIEESERRPS
jgi:hypothetical protein